MDQKLLDELAKNMAASGAQGVNQYMIYALAVFVIAVIGFLCRDYATNHKTMILVISENNRIMANNNRIMLRLKKCLRTSVRPRRGSLADLNPSLGRESKPRAVPLSHAVAGGE